MNTHAVQAVQCFFRSIALCKTNSLQDTLRYFFVVFGHFFIIFHQFFIFKRFRLILSFLLQTVNFMVRLRSKPRSVRCVDRRHKNRKDRNLAAGYSSIDREDRHSSTIGQSFDHAVVDGYRQRSSASKKIRRKLLETDTNFVRFGLMWKKLIRRLLYVR